MSEIQRVGPTYGAAGTPTPFRADTTGAQAVTDAHGRYWEAVRLGKMYGASMQAGASLGTALTATAVTLTLYNPTNSGVYLVLNEVGVAITTGPAAAGSTAFALAGNVNPLAAAPATNTLGTVRNCLLGGAAGVGIAYTATTLPAAPVILRTVGSIHIIGATPVSEAGFFFVDDTAGKIVLAPNTAVTVQGIGTATSGIVSMLWEEVPIQ